MADLVLAAGMPRSGSTLLYNIVRLCLVQLHGEKLLAGWISDIRRSPVRPVCLVKTHQIGLLYLRASRIFYSYRDVRDALVSSQRKFGLVPAIELCRTWIKEDATARKHASAVFRYEEFTVNQSAAIERVASVLGIDVDVSAVLESIPGTSTDRSATTGYDKQTLQHGGHATETGTGAWRTELDRRLLDSINDNFGWWIDQNGYDRE